MDHAAILAKVSDLMVDIFDLDDYDVTEETSADDIDEWDSLSHIRFVITVERAFKIKFSNEEISGMKNVGDLVAVVGQKLQ